MADRTMNMKVLHVTKTAAQWADWEAAELAATPPRTAIITKGILCVEMDANGQAQLKVGDGVHKYSELGYVTDAAIEALGNIFTVKGVVASTSLLPQSGNKTGDVYFVGPKSGAQSGDPDQYAEYVWTSAGAWEYIGEVAATVTALEYTLGGATKSGSTLIITLTCSDNTKSSSATIKIGTGLTVANDGTINHSNSVTEQSTAALKKFTFDAHGHITGVADISGSDLPKATASSLGVVQVGSNLSVTNDGVLSATDTTYSAGTGLSLSGTTINHSNSVTAGTASGSATGTLTFGGTFDLPTVTYDAQGHVTAKGTTTLTMPTPSPYSLSGATKKDSANANRITLSDGTNSSYADITYGTNLTVASNGTVNHSTSGVTAITDSALLKKIKVDAQGHVTATADVSGSDLPKATASSFGVIQVGSNLSVSDGVLSGNYQNATGSAAGLMSSSDYTKLSGISIGATAVSVSGLEANGTSIGTITIDGTANSIKVPSVGITTSSATTGVVELAPNTKYQLSAGGSTVVFKTPAGAVTDVQVNGTSVVSSGVAALGAAAGKGVTDNSTWDTAVTSSDVNLITGRTLYNAGYIHKDDNITITCVLDFPSNE